MRRAAILLAALLAGFTAWGGPARAADAPPAAASQHQDHAKPDAKPGSGHVHPAPEAQAAAPAPAPTASPAQKADAPKPDAAKADAPKRDAVVTEHVGAMADLNAVFATEDGATVRLGDVLDKPTIIAPVYYSCPNECNVLLGTLSTVLPEVGLKPGVEYQVLAVSFDELDTPATATKRKGDFFAAGQASGLGKFPPQAWRFLTGDLANINRLMDSIGFGFYRSGDAFRHPIALIVLTPSGKISRYLYGIRPLAFDIAMAATEAGAEKTGLSVKRAIAMCYTYDPQGRRYVFDFMKVAGAGVLTALGIFGLFLAFGGKKRGQPPRT